MEREPPPPRMGIFSRIFPVENPAGVLCWFDLLRGVKPVADHVSISAYKRVINLPPRPAAGVGCFMLSGQEPARVILQCGSLVPISSPPSFFPPFPTSAFFPPPPPTIFHRSPLVELQTSYQTPRQLSWEEFMRPVKRRWTPAAFLMTKFRDSPCDRLATSGNFPLREFRDIRSVVDCGGWEVIERDVDRFPHVAIYAEMWRISENVLNERVKKKRSVGICNNF